MLGLNMFYRRGGGEVLPPSLQFFLSFVLSIQENKYLNIVFIYGFLLSQE
jgi:hypothetical protein